MPNQRSVGHMGHLGMERIVKMIRMPPKSHCLATKCYLMCHENNTRDDAFNARVSNFYFSIIFLFIEQPTYPQVNLIIKKIE
jgi:hypothetical protein